MPGKDIPSYGQLPVSTDRPPGSSWGLFDDTLGALDLITPERIRDAAALIREGQVFSLALEAHLPDPPLFKRERTVHTVLASPTGFSFNDTLAFNTQASTQWDGFRHMRHPEHGFYGGLPAERHGVAHWARRGIVGRGVLADVARSREAAGRPIKPDEPDPIEPDDIRTCLREQDVELRSGDILLLRTGWVAWYRGLSADERARYTDAGHPSCGLRPGPATSELLWDLHISAVAADNPGLEVWPRGALLSAEEQAAIRADRSTAPESWLHFSAIALLGLAIGELFDLDGLAGHCSREKRYDCFFVSAPMPIEGGVASPANPLAIV